LQHLIHGFPLSGPESGHTAERQPAGDTRETSQPFSFIRTLTVGFGIAPNLLTLCPRSCRVQRRSRAWALWRPLPPVGTFTPPWEHQAATMTARTELCRVAPGPTSAFGPEIRMPHRPGPQVFSPGTTDPCFAARSSHQPQIEKPHEIIILRVPHVFPQLAKSAWLEIDRQSRQIGPDPARPL